MTADEAADLVCKNSHAAGVKTNGVCNKPVAIVELAGRDLADANKGRWIRTRADGSRNSSDGKYEFRPHLKKIAKGRDF